VSYVFYTKGKSMIISRTEVCRPDQENNVVKCAEPV
jgi:hypothetical protein